MYVESSVGIGRIVAEREKMNQSTAQVPPVRPHQLVLLEHYAFWAIVPQHQQRLQKHWAPVELILLNMIIKNSLLPIGEKSSLTQSWSTATIIRHMMKPGLLSRAGQMVRSILWRAGHCLPWSLPRAQWVSYFKGRKEPVLESVTDFFLEGILHSKQFHMLKGL